jgi:type I restriction-modification system DNA methylase subunit
MLNLDSLQTRLSKLNSTEALRALFADWSYEVDFAPVYLPQATKADEKAREHLAEDPEILARAGEFEIIYAPLRDWKGAIGAQRLVISRLLSTHPFALWIFSDKSEKTWHFVNVKRGAGKGQAAMSRHILRRFSFRTGDTPGRTSVEQLQNIDLAALATLPGMAPPVLAVQARHDAAFDVEAVTRSFFKDYKLVFEAVEAKVNIRDESERRLWTQRLFNRLMFLRFLEKKGWLAYDGDKNYLRALFKATDKGESFLNDRLYFAFFYGLNTDSSQKLSTAKLLELRGEVPFLNGGLFEVEEDGFDERGKVKLSNAAFEPILELFDKYNFTITESTPFDQEIGIDPEMLGKVFEELVTGRHETGSYYTPRGIVSFMGREALKGYLENVEAPQAVARFVDEGDATALRDPERVLQALRDIKICDPACGSGAYLLGMMQELLRLRDALFATKAKDHRSIFQRKLEIIENNLYGVDKDEFAVNIAMLRLWLSLIIEYSGDNPPPLPNLSYKIGCGDSLAAPLMGATQLVMHDQALREFVKLKGEFLRAHGAKKKALHTEIEKARADIRLWTHSGENINGFDWIVDFAEVFVPREEAATVFGTLNLGVQLPSNPEPGGFDIVLANPPYVRMELFKEQKPTLRKNFPEAHSDRADLYVYFYARAQQLLKDGGMLTFISPNKWLRAGYGGNLRKMLAAKTTVRSITDFGELPVFENAATFPMVIVAKKNGQPLGRPMFTQVKSLDPPYPDVLALNREQGSVLSSGAIAGEDWHVADAATGARLNTMRKSGLTLDEYVKGQVYRGVVTGLNSAFIVNEATRNQLIKADAKSSALLKPMAKGDDVRRWRVENNGWSLIYASRGINIRSYPAIEEHLKPFKAQLEARATQQAWYELQQPQGRFVPVFDSPKIVYPEIAKEPRFAFDKKGLFVNNKAFVFGIIDFYLLGVLNSAAAWEFVKRSCTVLGDEDKGGRVMLQWINLKKLPIPAASAGDKKAIEELVEACVKKKGQACSAEEAEINARVAKLYGLGS